MRHSILLGFCLISCLGAESRVWKSISGSTIEARLLGAFGEDYWFEASEDGKFIKMPAKYIAETDLKLVESGEVKGALPASICDDDPRSIHLLEQIYTSPAVELDAEIETIREAVRQLIEPFQPTAEDAERIEVSFTRRKYGKVRIPETLEKGTVLKVLKQVLEPHDLSFRIREGGLVIGPARDAAPAGG